MTLFSVPLWELLGSVLTRPFPDGCSGPLGSWHVWDLLAGPALVPSVVPFLTQMFPAEGWHPAGRALGAGTGTSAATPALPSERLPALG